MSAAAAKFKLQGNTHFKAGRFAKASDLYAKAEKADPHDAVYPSNLSASLYEMGDYEGAIGAILRWWTLVKDSPESMAKSEPIVRLSTRLAKSLCHGIRSGTDLRNIVKIHRDSIAKLQETSTRNPTMGPNASAADDLARVWREWEALQLEIDEYAKQGDACMSNLSRLPIFFKPLDHAREFYTIGTDNVIDLTQGWGPSISQPLQLDKLPPERLSKNAFLFGGVGDGRHVFGTLFGLRQAYTKLSKAKQRRFHAHLTLLDIHDATIARDLCMVMLLHSLNNETDATAKLELKTTLMYTYLGVAMPPYCYNILQGVFEDLLKRLSASPPDMPSWLHVVSDTIPFVTAVLEYWIKAKKSTSRMLTYHQPASHTYTVDPTCMLNSPGVNSDFARKHYEKVTSERESMKAMLLSATDDQLKLVVPKEVRPEDQRGYLRDNVDELVDVLLRVKMSGNTVSPFEEAWYFCAQVFLPPKGLLSRHPGFADGLKQMQDSSWMQPATQRKIQTHIKNEWKPNITLFDLQCANPKYYLDADGYPDLGVNNFQNIAAFDLFCRDNGLQTEDEDYKRTASEVCNAFFDEAAAALKALGHHVVVEFICGSLSEELAKMRFKGDSTRPKEFPREYTRIWLSNVPDYTHGPMNMILYVVPSLQDNAEAAVACNCLLNMPVWANDEEFIHTYTLLLPTEIPRYLGCPVLDTRALMNVFVLGSQRLPRPLDELATREELTHWLTRVLFNTFIPALPHPRPNNVRLPHNLVAFFGIVMHLHRVGYPGHWLSEFLARVLSGTMTSDVAPYTARCPIPISERSRRVQSRRVRTDPWLVEFENIIATAYFCIPFPVALLANPEFSRDPADIVVWQAEVLPLQPFFQSFFSSPSDPHTTLLFYERDVVSSKDLIKNLPKILEGKPTPEPGTFFVLTAQEYMQYQTYIRFRLSRRRVERMRNELWSMIAYRNDTNEQVTLPVSIVKWTLFDENAAAGAAAEGRTLKCSPSSQSRPRAYSGHIGGGLKSQDINDQE